MSELMLKNRIINNLNQCEEIRKSIDQLVKAYSDLKEGDDGVTRLIILTKGGVKRLETDLSTDLTKEVINCVIDKYNCILKDTQKGINVFIESCMEGLIE